MFTQQRKGIAIQELRDGELDFDVEEHYAPLFNGLPVTFLNDSKGVRQDSAPDKIGSNTHPLQVGMDKRIHINIACLQCHNQGVLQPIEDVVRATYTGRLGVLSNDKNVALELSRQYGSNLYKALEKDRAEYQEAFIKPTGVAIKQSVELYSKAFTNYAYTRITRAMAARELGVREDQLTRALRDASIRLGHGDFRTDTFLLDVPRSIPRLTWEDAFQDTQDLLFGVLKE